MRKKRSPPRTLRKVRLSVCVSCAALCFILFQTQFLLLEYHLSIDDELFKLSYYRLTLVSMKKNKKA